MAITIVKEPYEVLIRFRDGIFSGAHIKDLEKIIGDDGVTIISQKETQARPIYQDNEEYSAILAGINTAILAENESLKNPPPEEPPAE